MSEMPCSLKSSRSNKNSSSADNFGAWSPPIEIPLQFEEIISNPSSSILSIIEDPNLLPLFHEEEDTITNRLIISFGDLMDLFYETNKTAIINIIRELFLSRNFHLLEMLNDVSIIDYFSQIFESSDLFKIGISSQIILAGLDKWPAEFMAVLYQSNNFFPTILKRIDKTAVYFLIDRLVHVSDAYSPGFIWGFFLSLMKGKCKENPPIKWDTSNKCISLCKETELNLDQRLLLYRILYSFLEISPEETEFFEIVSSSLPKMMENAEELEEKAEILNFAINFQSTVSFIETALYLARYDQMNSDIAEKSISYLSLHVRMAPIGEIIQLFHKQLTKATPNNFVYRISANLIEETLEKHSEAFLFHKVMQHIIAYSWNHPSDHGLMYRSFILGYATIFGDNFKWSEWTTFYSTIVDPFSRRISVRNTNFVFNEENWDHDLIDCINRGETDFTKFVELKKRHLSMFVDKEKNNLYDYPNTQLPTNAVFPLPVVPPKPVPDGFRPDRIVFKVRPKSSTPQPFNQSSKLQHKKNKYSEKKQKNCNVC